MLKDVEIAGKKSKKQLSKGINALVEEYMKAVSVTFPFQTIQLPFHQDCNLLFLQA